MDGQKRLPKWKNSNNIGGAFGASRKDEMLADKIAYDYAFVEPVRSGAHEFLVEAVQGVMNEAVKEKDFQDKVLKFIDKEFITEAIIKAVREVSPLRFGG